MPMVKCKHCCEIIPFCYFDAHMQVEHDTITFNGVRRKEESDSEMERRTR